MPPPDSGAVDAALITKLATHAPLTALAPDGVWFDEGPPGATRFVIVSLVDAVDAATYDQGRTIESLLYMVKFVELKPASGPGVAAAAARAIDLLLEDGTLTVAGFGLMTMHRESRDRRTEVDSQDASIRWYHRVGNYRVQVAVA